MSEPFLGEIKIVAFNFPPRGWAFCEGQLLPINQNQSLYSLLGTTYGGDGRTTFAIPDLRGRALLHKGDGYTLGERGGAETVTLTASEIGAHNHGFHCSNNEANFNIPKSRFFAKASAPIYDTSLNNTTSLNSQSMIAQGGGAAHNNIQPILVLSYCIALQGLFPSRN